MIWWAFASLILVSGAVVAITAEREGWAVARAYITGVLIFFPLWWLWLKLAGVL